MKATYTYVDALNEVLNSALRPDCREKIEALRDSLTKRATRSDEAIAKANKKRRIATAAARSELIEKVAPILRKHLATDITAKALYEAAASELPEGFSAAKVQNVLIREMAQELIKTEAKGKPNLYRLKETA